MYESWVNGIMKKWTKHNADEEMYEVIIHKDKSVTSVYGRFSHSSGSSKVSWSEFMAGEMNELVSKTMGIQILSAVKEYIREQGI